MGCRKASLDCSGSRLLHPDGSIDLDVLESILRTVVEHQKTSRMKQQPSPRVLVTRDRRVEGFDPAHPEWEDVRESYTIRTLRRWYQEIRGTPFEYEESLEKHNLAIRCMEHRGYDTIYWPKFLPGSVSSPR